jgi:DNA repair protein SbcC/Rad50
MKPTRLTAKNWLSFKELDYNFVDKPLQIQGRNLSDDDQDSNGSGKSSIQAAIEKLLFDTTSRKVKDSDLINYSAEEAELSLEIYCPVRKQTLKIERVLRIKGSNLAQVSVNDVVQYSFEDKMVREINDFIISWIGIDKEDLQNYYIINKDRFQSFFTSSNTSKIELLNRFSNANKIDGVDVDIKKEITTLEEVIGSLKTKNSSLDGKIELLNQKIEQEKQVDFNSILEEKNQDKLQRIQQYKESIKLLEEDILDKQNFRITRVEKIKEFTDNLLEVQKKLNSLANTSFANEYVQLEEKRNLITAKVAEKRALLSTYTSKLDEATEILNDINKNLMGTTVCPKCSHEFKVGNPDIDIEAEKQDKVSVEKTIASIQAKITEFKANIQEVKKEEIPLNEEEQVIKDKERELRRLRQSIDSSITEIQSKIQSENRSLLSIDNLIEESKIKISSLKDLIKTLSETKEMTLEDFKREQELKIQAIEIEKANYVVQKTGISEDISKKEIELMELKSWIINFKKFQFHLAGKSLKIIQGYCNMFLEKMRSDIRVKLEGYKEKANGEMKEEITPYIVRDIVRPFGSFSGGERGRVEYAGILTLQHMINSTNKFGGLQFLSTDEIAEGVDAKGLQSIIGSLNEFKFPILITTHVVDRSVNENVLVVVKEKGVSKILN